MALSREAFNDSTFSFYVHNTDPPTPEYDIAVLVNPKGYPWQQLPYAKVSIELKGNERPYKVVVTDIVDHGGIGHHAQIKKKARDWFEKRYGKLFRAA